MTILEAMETLQKFLEARDSVPREKAVAAYNAVADALDMSAQPCIGHIALREGRVTPN